MSAKTRVMGFFAEAGIPLGMSRLTISAGTSLGFPSVDAALQQLELEGLLVRCSDDVWKPTKAFDFSKAIKKQKRDEAKERWVESRRLSREAREKRQAELRFERSEWIKARYAERVAREAEQRSKILAEREKKRAERQAQIAAGLEKAKEIVPPELVVQAREKVKPVEPSDDPWQKIRARHYGRPQLLPSTLRELTPDEKMTGRRLHR